MQLLQKSLFSITNKIKIAGVIIGISCSTMLSTPVNASDFHNALKSAYETNPRLQAQRKLLEATNENLPQALSGWLPSISAGYDRGRQRTRSTGEFKAGTAETQRLNLRQPIFSGGETIARTSAAKSDIMAARADLQSQEQNVLFNAVTAYMDVVRDLAIYELSQNNEDVLRKQLKASKERFAVGESTRTDVAQSEARVARAETEKVQASGELTNSKSTFERVIGYMPEGLLTPPSEYPEIPNTLEEAINIAQENNPNITSNKHRYNSAEKNIDVNIAQLLPEVSVNGTMSRQEGAGFSGGSDFDSDSVTLNVDVPIFQSGAEHSRIRQAKLSASQQLFATKNQKDTIKESVIQAWQNLATSIASIRSTQESINAANVALEGVKEEQLFGSRTVLDVLDAEQELFSAKVNLVVAQHQRITSIYNLLSTMGKLTISGLDINADIYDPKNHYEDIKYQFIGF